MVILKLCVKHASQIAELENSILVNKPNYISTVNVICTFLANFSNIHAASSQQH